MVEIEPQWVDAFVPGGLPRMDCAFGKCYSPARVQVLYTRPGQDYATGQRRIYVCDDHAFWIANEVLTARKFQKRNRDSRGRYLPIEMPLDT